MSFRVAARKCALWHWRSHKPGLYDKWQKRLWLFCGFQLPIWQNDWESNLNQASSNGFKQSESWSVKRLWWYNNCQPPAPILMSSLREPALHRIPMTSGQRRNSGWNSAHGSGCSSVRVYFHKLYVYIVVFFCMLSSAHFNPRYGVEMLWGVMNSSTAALKQTAMKRLHSYPTVMRKSGV